MRASRASSVVPASSDHARGSKKYLARLLEADAVLPDIGGCFVEIPHELHTAKAVQNVHSLRIYVVWTMTSSEFSR